MSADARPGSAAALRFDSTLAEKLAPPRLWASLASQFNFGFDNLVKMYSFPNFGTF
jgi:hypothetical protein